MNSRRAQIPQTTTRRKLLALVHIAKKELGYDDALYREILYDEFGVRSSQYLTEKELGRLVERFEAKGWKAKDRGQVRGQGPAPTGRKINTQAEALRERIGQELLHTDCDEKRLRGLVRKFCGVDDLQWCGDAVRLRRLLAVIGNMINQGKIAVNSDQ